VNSLLYRLARNGDINWLSYYFADFICARDGTAVDDLLGYSAALVSEANLDGNVCIELDHFCDRPLFHCSRADVTEIPTGPAANEWCANLRASRCVGEPGQSEPLIIECNRLYLNRFWVYENYTADKIMAMLERAEIVGGDGLGALVEAQFAGMQDIDEDQKNAVLSAASKPFSVISGGPGSGKTSTVIRILAVMLARNPAYRIALAAPTGKAAARMMDSIRQRIDQLELGEDIRSAIPREARTIHRLLGYRQKAFSYHEQHRLPFDCVVIDEASMIDLKLTYHLLAALPERAQLILLGDRDQLASVAAGNVLGDITGHGLRLDGARSGIAASTSLLRSNYRFNPDSVIGELAREVNQGHGKRALELLRANERGLRWFEESGEQVADDTLAWLYDAYQPIFDSETAAQALDAYESIRVLCATNHGPFGVETLNHMVSRALLARNRIPETESFAGLPIMITRNFQELGLYNGDTGILWSYGDSLRACFRDVDGDIRDLSINRLPEFRAAWASTVHKSQGSEFDSVLLVLPADAQSEVLSRELLYTAITRARHRFLLHAPGKVVTRAIERLTRRHSGLAKKLGWLRDQPPGA
jgi:exodeoxyribonuclease V alpha subunit